ncbi:hypothetical protein BBP40_002841 [Aspergillus hancockii]|nr:hypothetical protein BBP40_002841 [Aspergillus hancockii]
MATKRVVVAGGNGFLGSRICSSPERPAWASSVEWAKADMLKPETYKSFLSGATAVVHTIALAQETSNEHVPTFVFISAAAGAPVLPSRYITTKREAETTISTKLPDLRSVFMRAPFMYDSSRKFTLPIALGGFIGSQFNELFGNRLDFLGTMVTKPFQVDIVGEAVVEAMEDESVRGAVGTKKIEALSTKAWRKSML